MRRRPAVRFIQAAVLLDILGIGLILPVLPTLIGTLTTSRDAQTYWYSGFVVAYGLMQFLCAPLLGAVSDRFGRRPVLLISIAGLALMFLVPALSASLWVILASRFIGGATAASLAVANAYIADISPPEERAQSFGKVGAMFGIGFIVGPAAGGTLGAIDVHLPFFVAAALSAANFAYGWFVLPESLPRARRCAVVDRRKANPLASLIGLAQLRGVGLLVAVLALINLAQFILHSTWVLYTEFRHGWGPAESGWSLFVVGVVAAVVQGVLLGRLLHAFGETRLVLAGMTSAALAYAAYALVPYGWLLYVAIACNFLGFTTLPALQAIVSRAVPAHEQGHAMGAIASLASLMMVAAPFIGGPLLAFVSHLPRGDWRLGTPYLFSVALQLLALALAASHFARHRRLVHGTVA
jgi:DHA1 family tetracycline resistance protein-like MFS transporter